VTTPDPIARLNESLAGRYRIERELGAGGMATVYLAHDLKHDRSVAIKVLKPELAAVIGGARFLTEIRTTANLQHPHILSLHDSGEVDGTVFYVMPFVDGESLRDRLARERQLPIDVAIAMASEVADALQYAHDHGVIHRDIKPENILLHGGHALVMDFGIALAATTTGGARMTETGMSLGTPTYMSPEQAMGERTLDARSDINALGCVLYEMLVGDPPFIGSTAQAIVAKVLTEKPRSIIAQRERVPEPVEAAVLTSLEKLSADRFASAREFALALREGPVTARSTSTHRGVRATQIPRWLPIVTGAAMLVAGVAIGRLALRRAAGPDAASALSIALPDSARLAFNGNLELPGGQGSLAITPDGHRLAWVGTGPHGVRLYLRDMDSYNVRVLEGTDGAFGPFFSMDGATLGYFSGTELRTVAMSTGESRVVARDVQEPSGGAFLSDGRILYATFFSEAHLVSRSGAAQTIKMVDEKGKEVEQNFVYPSIVAGDAYAVGVERGGQAIEILTLSTGTVQTVARADASKEALHVRGSIEGSSPKIIGNRLVWLAGDVLMSATVDAAGARLTSEAVVVASGVRGDINYGGDFALAAGGTIAFVAGGDPMVGKLAWLQRGGRVDTLPLPPANYRGWDISPDGRRVVTRIVAAGALDEYRVFDIARGISTKLELSAPSMSQPVWTADGRFVLASVRQNFADSGVIVRIAGDGGQRPDTIARGFPSRWATSRDGKVILFGGLTADGSGRTFMMASVNGGNFAPLAHRGTWMTPAFSADGKWVAYEEQSGRLEVFVEPFPADGRRFQVSNDGGYEAVFSRSGDQIFYRNGRRIMAVSFAPGTTPALGKPTEYIAYDFSDFEGRAWMLAPDGRFLIKLLPSYTPRSEIRVLSGALSPERLRAAKEGTRK
jgi:Tol biopolymer transport system component